MHVQSASSVENARAGAGASRQRVVLVGILFVTLLVAYLDRVNVSVLVADPSFLQAMGLAHDPVGKGLLMTLFLVAYGVANVVLSPLGDVMGPRKAMCLSILLWGVALLVGGLSTSFQLMLAGRVALGIGEGMQWPMQSKYVKYWFPPAERGKANSVWLVGLMVGPALAMPLFAWLIKTLGWRPSFFLLAALGLVPLSLLWFFTSDHPRQYRWVNRAELDHIEAGLRAEAAAEAAGDKMSLSAAVRGFVSNYRFWLLTVFYACFASVWWGTMTWLPSYLKVARGFSWSVMGMWSSVPYFLGAVCILAIGFVTDRTGRHAPFAAVSMLGAAAGIFFGARASDNTVSALLISLGVAAIAIGLPAAWTILQRIVPSRAVGAGAGMMNGVANGASALAPVLIGWFISVTGGYQGGLMFLVGLSLVGFACMAVLVVQRY
jgi:sugar phosphate permease